MPRIILPALLFLLAGCAGATIENPPRPLPERVLLHYDFSGDWVATAGDQCSERLDLSDTVFLSVANAPDGTPDRYYVADFFLLEPGEPAESIPGTADYNGQLTLAVETKGLVDGQRAPITYDLLLEQETALNIRLRSFTMTVRDRNGRPTETDLLAAAAADPSIPILGSQGSRGLCLKRL